MKPLSCIPLLGCDVQDSPVEPHGQPCFCLNQSRTTHTFCCDDSDLKMSWLAVLKVAVIGEMPPGAHCGNSISDGSRCEINGNMGNDNNGEE